MKIAGLDVGRGYAVAAILDAFPANIQQHFKQNKKQFLKLTTDAAGVSKFLDLGLDAIVLEPSGHWYSAFWANLAKAHGIEICWISHGELHHQRGHYGFTNKRDDEDALSLAATYFDERFIDVFGNKRFLKHYQLEKIAQIRELFLQIEQLDKMRSGMIAHIKQRLACEFPETIKRQFNLSKKLGFSPLIGWLAGEYESNRYEREYGKSVAHAIGISLYTREHALALVELERRIFARELGLENCLSAPEFSPYLKVFERFGFGLTNQALLLYTLYPFEKFLVQGKPWIEWEEAASGKRQKRHRSLRQFQAFLGLSFHLEESGDSKKKRFHGSTMVRSHLYAWAVCQIAARKNGNRSNGQRGERIPNGIGAALGAKYASMRDGDSIKLAGKDSLVRVLFVATRILFRELVKELT